jgi:hypothetical protein
MPQQQLARPEPKVQPTRPVLADDPPRFLLLEREVEIEYRPQMLAALQSKVDAFAGTARGTVPVCPQWRPPDALPRHTGGLLAGALRMLACSCVALPLPALPL